MSFFPLWMTLRSDFLKASMTTKDRTIPNYHQYRMTYRRRRRNPLTLNGIDMHIYSAPDFTDNASVVGTLQTSFQPHYQREW
ncbi:hypothetical protein L3H50_05725 [Corynebacterium sp. MC-04]|uniref:hypothetical protein n=1 Tax=Corynebacterium TaxID=1716 RepID=UPI001EF0FB62|nr:MULTISPECIES: hypothetical protein [Corynebacterium]MCF6769767.1 hypothetical protein [Corynebacterium parakroppenstedtii]MCF6771591.1 hypothetical protein [Corynebacterium parakroppenstedtii]MCF6778875.1 hypothetical protein [Corynebacterium parakroppenstedtii]MCF6789035.1 hypothetical protein [Corynebacterium parakroppenstedtii]MCF6809762.1 hypothetical protein [Corynebacterium parakroppenstedtii]